ncbi:MAG: MFS transporter [Gemmataceae bacterium]|nr:MFS transporter [Gemmataceae bacterium]
MGSVRTVAAGAIGNALEWYDFGLFGYFAPIISSQYFPSSDPRAALLNTFGVFAAGFLMRPIGAIMFGHLGDRKGRKWALGLSVLLMAVPTALVGLLPTYHQLGLVAPALLLLVRLLQGLSVGGEYVGSMSYLAESAQPGRRGFDSSWCNVSGGVGGLSGAGLAAVITRVLTPEQVADWGWRLPFLLSIPAGLASWWLRQSIPESPCFTDVCQAGQVARVPLRESLRSDRAGFLTMAGLSLLASIGWYLPWVWLVTWLDDINQPPMPEWEALTSSTLAGAVLVVLTPLGGALSDRLGRKPVILAGSVGYLVLSYPMFLWMSQGTFTAALSGQLVSAVLSALYGGASLAAFVEIFPTRTRYSGLALSYNLAVAICGGTTPLVATWLVTVSGSTLTPAFYLMAAALGTTLAAWAMPERANQPLT